MARVHRIACMALVLCAGLLVASAAARSEAVPCVACHSTVQPGHHGAAGVSCSACHGDGVAHVQAPASAGSILRFGSSEPAARRDAACLGCHSSAQAVTGSHHQRAGVACHSCHSSHDAPAQPAPGQARLDPASARCATCHADTLASFRLNERHRLLEGSIGCTDCHTPHSDAVAPGSGGSSATCAGCHPQVSGPFVFEHAPQRTEGCAACHAPHGNSNRHLLHHQRVGDMCHSCHAAVPQFHLGFNPVAPPRFDGSTVCTNCHQSIHGSNLSRDFLR